jgi:antitoxin MazE
MQVSKWGNSLAIRIPNVVVQTLKLKEGDEVEVTVVGDRELVLKRDGRREKALETIRQLARPFPAGWRFDREDAADREREDAPTEAAQGRGHSGRKPVRRTR